MPHPKSPRFVERLEGRPAHPRLGGVGKIDRHRLVRTWSPWWIRETESGAARERDQHTEAGGGVAHAANSSEVKDL